MSRSGVFALLVSLVLIGTVSAAHPAIALADEPALAEMASEGVRYEPVTSAPGLDLPSPGDLLMVRVQLAPGAHLPLDAADPTGGVLLTESGTFTIEAQSPFEVSRAMSPVGAFATAKDTAIGEHIPQHEAVLDGRIVHLAPGDAADLPGYLHADIRNDGPEPAVGLMILIVPTSVPPATTTPSPTPVTVDSSTP